MHDQSKKKKTKLWDTLLWHYKGRNTQTDNHNAISCVNIFVYKLVSLSFLSLIPNDGALLPKLLYFWHIAKSYRIALKWIVYVTLSLTNKPRPWGEVLLEKLTIRCNFNNCYFSVSGNRNDCAVWWKILLTTSNKTSFFHNKHCTIKPLPKAKQIDPPNIDLTWPYTRIQVYALHGTSTVVAPWHFHVTLHCFISSVRRDGSVGIITTLTSGRLRIVVRFPVWARSLISHWSSRPALRAHST
jgi:hypothetical protein